MIYTKKGILGLLESGGLILNPINHDNIGSNSIDLTLGKNLLVCKVGGANKELTELDPKQELTDLYELVEIPKEGYLLPPNTLVLGVTREYTEHHDHVAIMHGNSSNARMGLSAHVCAGFGDIGFKGHWTLELTAVVAVRIYEGMVIGQLALNSVIGDFWPEPYGGGVTYNNAANENPMPSIPNLHLKPHKFQ